MAGTVLVTGSTGNVGGPLLAALRARREPARGAAMDAPPARDAANGDHPDGADAVRFDFLDPATWPAALDGVDRVFLMRPPALDDPKRQIRPFVEELGRRRIRHVVVLSVLGVNRVMPHWQVEQDVAASGCGWTSLRPSFFMQNLTGPYRDDIVERGEIRQPAGTGRFSWIDAADIAEAAANVLVDPTLAPDRAVTVTGPEAIGYHEVASMLSATLGRPVHYRPTSLRADRRRLIDEGMPSSYANVQVVINLTARLGMAAKVTDDLPRLLGRPPTTLARFLDANRTAFDPTPDR
jgi:uncharacterized protein YbjT (DUF2867 family)